MFPFMQNVHRPVREAKRKALEIIVENQSEDDDEVELNGSDFEQSCEHEVDEKERKRSQRIYQMMNQPREFA